MSGISAGTRLGPYEIVAPLGAGGMGEVWRGRDTRLDRNVAIKILPADFAQNAQLKLRFEREARAISQLNHPNICTLYDVGDSFIVMELLEGESLADRLAKGPLPLADVLRYGTQIAEALDRAHRAGIVHRDLKPGNVMITRSGAKLLDFGLAKSVQIVGGDGATVQKSLTQEGTILGTFQYMAPEQLEGEEADARTDIFALGTLLYEMATGRRAFPGKTKTSLIAAIVSAQPQPISQVVPLTPPALDHVIQKCLAKDREARWQSAFDIAEELRWIAETPAQALVAERSKRNVFPWLALVILAIATVMFFRSRQQPKSRQVSLTIPTIESNYRAVSSPALSPDGQTLYFVGLSNENKRVIFRRNLNEFHATPLEGLDGVVSIVMSPDGRSLIAAFSGGVFKRVGVDGGPPESAGVAEAMAGAAVAPDGTFLVGSSNLDLPIRRVWPAGKVEPLFDLDKSNGELGQRAPTFLPEHKRWGLFHEEPRFLFLSCSRDARGSIHFMLCAASLGSKSVKRIGEVPSEVRYAAGHLFFVRDGTLMAQPFDVDNLSFTGEAQPVVTDVVWSSRTGAAVFDVASNGTIFALKTVSAARLTWVDQAGHKAATVGGPLAIGGGLGGTGLQTLAFTSKRDAVLVCVNDHRAGVSSIWIEGLTRETANRLTLSSGNEAYPVISRDGSRVFFSTDEFSAAPDVAEAPIDGSQPSKMVFSAPNSQAPSDVSSDGRFLLFTSNSTQAATRQDLWILPLQGGGKAYPFVATPAVENQGRFSPDVKWIAYASDVTGSTQVYVRPFPGPGAAITVSTKGGNAPRWSADGKKIYFVNVNKVFVADFSAGNVSEPKLLFELGDRIQAYEPVGDRFLMILLNEVDAAQPARVIVNWQPATPRESAAR